MSKSWIGEITEEAAGLGDVGLVRRGRIVPGEADRVQGAELAALDEPARLAVARIEAALEAELERDAAMRSISAAIAIVVLERRRQAASRRTSAGRARCDARISVGVGAWSRRR